MSSLCCSLMLLWLVSVMLLCDEKTLLVLVSQLCFAPREKRIIFYLLADPTTNKAFSQLKCALSLRNGQLPGAEVS